MAQRESCCGSCDSTCSGHKDEISRASLCTWASKIIPCFVFLCPLRLWSLSGAHGAVEASTGQVRCIKPNPEKAPGPKMDCPAGVGLIPTPRVCPALPCPRKVNIFCVGDACHHTPHVHDLTWPWSHGAPILTEPYHFIGHGLVNLVNLVDSHLYGSSAVSSNHHWTIGSALSCSCASRISLLNLTKTSNDRSFLTILTHIEPHRTAYNEDIYNNFKRPPHICHDDYPRLSQIILGNCKHIIMNICVSVVSSRLFPSCQAMWSDSWWWNSCAQAVSLRPCRCSVPAFPAGAEDCGVVVICC